VISIPPTAWSMENSLLSASLYLTIANGAIASVSPVACAFEGVFTAGITQ
jgi:hypothetical protein